MVEGIGFSISCWGRLSDVGWQVVLIKVVVYHVLLLLLESVVSAAEDVLFGNGLPCLLEAASSFWVVIAACVVAGIKHLIVFLCIAGHAHHVPLLM